jgi:hypothetical protein
MSPEGKYQFGGLLLPSDYTKIDEECGLRRNKRGIEYMIYRENI